ncbi:hypothetical protein [Actinopolyspora mortivallis]|uniref:Uncharacterized protein n=1 Tax=Actinopolyspora mortivallis TaxID=33906 RepID=A0A2T0GRQ6_ACTMO|nr:hypothetical protein [Actinopolyspora mortivallis]PRW61784.1 hypothetical protein CEP50_18885 [Actinopolyspora mortivallis]
MDSAKPNGWSGELDEPSTRPPGERCAPERRCVRLGTHTTAPRHGTGDSARGNTAEPWDMLHELDLGMVPASVTPPRTWRRAAWFAVTASAATLCGIVFATAALAPHPDTRTTAEPVRVPRGHGYPFPPDEEANSPERHAPPTTRPDRRMLVPSTPATKTSRRERPSQHPGAPDDTGTWQRAPLPPLEASPTRPPETTERTPLPTSTETAPARGEQYAVTTRWSRMRELTERYFSAVAAGELRAAYRMTGGRLHEAGFTEFSSRYEDAGHIGVSTTVVEAESTVTELRITRGDETETVRRRLRFDASQRHVVADLPATGSR